MNKIEKLHLQAQLSPERRALLEHLYAEKRAQRRQGTRITPQPAGEPSPLSFAQERLWFMEQLDPHNPQYNEHASLLITGSLDLTALEACFNVVIQRHEVLRTIFTANSEQQMQQQVLPELLLKLQLSDISTLSSAEQELLLGQIDAEWSAKPFDLLHGPLLRAKIVKLQPERHIILVTLHHTISDGWSIGLLTQELLAIYTARQTSTEPALPALAIQYHDFAYWQRHTYQKELLDQQLSYWKQQLAGPLPFTEWPADRFSMDPAQEPDYRGAVQIYQLPAQLTNGIQAHCTRLGITSFMFFLATFALLLGRHSGQEDILLGSPIAGRTRKEVEHLIGCFINTLALRVDLTGNPTFEALLERIKAMTFEAYAQQEVPFEKIVQELQPERNLNRNPLFNILFNFNNTPQTALKLAGMQIERVELSPQSAKFPLTMYVNETTDGTQLRVVYQAELYSQHTIQVLLDQYRFLLSQIVDSPDLPISAYSLVTPESSALIPDPRLPLPASYYPSVTHLIMEQAHRQPQQIALRQGTHEWSYHSLLERATTIARTLIAAGLQPGNVVAVHGTRGPGLIAAMCGILFSGGVLLPIDEALPAQRQHMLLTEANTRYLLLIREAIDATPSEIAMAASTLTTFTIIQSTGQIIGDINESDQTKEQPLTLPQLGPKDPAYIFFTSGTTGKPKGVLGNHQGLSHFLTWQRTCFEVSANDRCAQLTGLSFDVVLRDIFLALSSGATLVIPIDPENLSAHTILPWLAKEQITILHTTPSIMQSWIGQARSADLTGSALRLLFLAGEPLTRSLIQDWRPLLPEASEVVNLYGPTETSLAKCYQRVPLTTAQLERPRIPIGRPLPETQVFIFSSSYTLCGIGEIGEIVIRTPFRSSGYINAIAEQQERFIPNPFRTDEHDLLYLTGDYGRYLADGRLDILGRLDKQIKIRGVRIEPNEVAAQLALHPALSACAVQVQSISEQPHLVAYVVLHPETQVTAHTLRTFLSAALPATFIPSAILFLEAMPLTANGKIDLQALPPLTMEHLTANEPSEAPETPTEELCATIWSEVLNLPAVGRHANFFALGGHSLLAMEIIARLENHLHVHIPLKTLFVGPTIAELALACDRLTADEHEQLVSLPTLVPHLEQRYEPFPLTDIQQAYWVGRSTSFEMGNIATHNYSEFTFNNLDITRFQQALQLVIQRHDMLRACIRSDGFQQILAEVPVYTLTFYDLSGAALADVEQHMAHIRHKLSHQIFPLDKWPFFELQVSKVSATRFIIHISIDALICDAWSRQIIGRELLLFYADPTCQLPNLPLSFRDYVLTELELRSTPLYQKARTYWLEKLATLPPAPELPLLINPKTVTAPHFVRRSGRLSPQSWQKLQARGHALGLTPSALICAAYVEILALWSKNSSLTVNLTLFNRLPLHPQVNELIGDFTSLTLLSTTGSAPTFSGRAKAVQLQLMEDLDQRAFSGIEVLRELNRRRGGETGALMPVVLTSTLGSSSAQQKDTLDAWYEGDAYGISQTPQVFIDHAVSEQRGGLVFRWDAVQEIFPEGMIEDMFRSYERLLQGLAEDEEFWHSNSRLHLLPRSHQELMAAVNATQAPFSSSGLLHSGFLKQAQQQPDALAIITAERKLSYHELDLRSAWLARQLYELGARPDHLIAVCMEKGWEQVVAVLAILRAGAAYLPIDAGLPEARRRHLLTQGEVALILTQPWLATTLEWPEDTQCLIVSDEEPPAEPAAPIPMQTTSGDLAYVIYTSGSTGLPKGVMIDHRGALNTIDDINQRFSISANDRVLALSALNFDLSVYDIFGLLAAGGCIVIPRAHTERDPQHWLELMVAHQVSIWNTVPALLEMLVEHTRATNANTILKDVRLALLSGDWIGLTLPERVWRLAPQIQLISLGGATEASIWSIHAPIEQVKPEWQSIPYGKPLRNQSWQVLNEHLEPCPIWVPGQLYIGGIGLAQGYWHDEEKTAASFITHPHNGERLYRTGDMGRYLPDGQIEFLGREDLQVKIQGHRIELGEIETTLENHPQVRSAIVLAHGASRSARTLVAYVVLQNSALQTQELRNYLHNQLPDYMVPSSFVLLDQIPLTPNGKVDRQALSKLEGISQPEEELISPLGAPRTAIEEQITLAFALILDLQDIDPGLNDNFFALGGNSISAIQLIARLNALFETTLPLRMLFENPTIAGIAQIVEHIKTERQHFPSLKRSERSAPLPLSLAQERIWFLCKLEPDSSFYNIPAAVKLLGPLNQVALEKAVQELLRRHETLRTLFPIQQGRANQLILPEHTPIPLKILDMRTLPAELQDLSLDAIIAREVDTPFDFEHEPSLRITLLKCQPEEHVFIVTMHHIISDAWSMEIFIRELIALYEAYAQDQPSPLSPLPYQFADFAAWQREWVQDPSVKAQLAYWRDTLAPLTTGTVLQTDYPRSKARSFRGERKTITFSKEQTRVIRALGLNEQVTPFMILLSAYLILLSHYQTASQEPIAVNTSIANRSMLATEGMIGFFLSTLIIATDLSDNPTITELLARVRNQSLEAYNHQDIPFEHIVKEMRPEHSLNFTPFSRVAFGLRNTPLKGRTAHKLTIEPIAVQRGMAKFDLELQLLDAGQQITGFLEYNAELFKKSTINRMFDQFMLIVSALMDMPHARLDTLLAYVKKSMEEKHSMEKIAQDNSFRKKLLGVKPKKVSVSQQKMFVTEQFTPEQSLPLIIKPAIADLNLMQCMKSNQELITEELAKHGGLLFRGFSVPDVTAFEQLVSTIAPNMLEYKERSTPRTQVSGTIYTSTEYPPDQYILLHNENSYSHSWPMKIAFFSQVVATRGGETPIADSRRIYQALPADLRERFASRGVMYVRNYGKHLDLSWQTAFQTSDRAQVEEYCRKAQIECEWLGLDRLRTRQVRQGVCQHPTTGEMVWFNQAHLFHVSSLDPAIKQSLLKIMEEQDLPRHAYYGDGSPLEPETLETIRAAYQQVTVSFPWQQNDVLLLDNMLVAHGRAPYEGARKVLVAMAEPLTQHFVPTIR